MKTSGEKKVLKCLQLIKLASMYSGMLKRQTAI